MGAVMGWRWDGDEVEVRMGVRNGMGVKTRTDRTGQGRDEMRVGIGDRTGVAMKWNRTWNLG